MKEIPLTQGKFAIVDDADFDRLNVPSWCFHKHGYAQCKSGGRVRKMHQFILDCPVGMSVDHANGNRLDNRRANLRLATRSQNAQNSRIRANKVVVMKGVSMDRGRYRARITLNQKTVFLGSFGTADEAHRAYCEAAPKVFGEFARIS